MVNSWIVLRVDVYWWLLVGLRHNSSLPAPSLAPYFIFQPSPPLTFTWPFCLADHSRPTILDLIQYDQHSQWYQHGQRSSGNQACPIQGRQTSTSAREGFGRLLLVRLNDVGCSSREDSVHPVKCRAKVVFSSSSMLKQECYDGHHWISSRCLPCCGK